jgi:hypothetical protein
MMKCEVSKKNESCIMNEKLRSRSPLFFAMILALLPNIFSIQAKTGDNDLFKLNSEQLSLNFDGYFQQAETAIDSIDVRLARQELSLIQFKIKKHQNQIPRDMKKTYESKLAALNALVKQKVDSLVKVNLTVLKKNGQTAGIEFRQQLAILRGLSEAELAAVDEAIINTAPAKGDETGARMLALPEAPSARVDHSQQGLPAPAPMEKPLTQPFDNQLSPNPASTTMKALPIIVSESVENKKPLFDMPVDSSPHPQQSQSTREFDVNRTTANTMAAKVRTLLNEGKIDEAMTVFNLYRPNMQNFLEQPVFDKLKSVVEDAYAQEQNQRAQALQLVQDIDTYIDQDRVPEAFKKFQTSREELRQSLDREEFIKLEERVGKANVNFGRAQGIANMKAREIRISLENKKIDEAALKFEKSRSELQRGLPNNEFDRLGQEMAAAYSALQDKRKLSKMSEKDIKSLIKEEKGAEAFARFNADSSMLRQNLNTGEFSTLKASVKQAYNDFLSHQAQALRSTGTIDSLLTSNKVLEALYLFNESKGRIRRDLADDKRFFELKERVTKAYDDFREKRRQAIRSADNIKYLINKKEGLNAFASYQQYLPMLKEYLEPRVCAKLEKAVIQAKAEYESNVAHAQSTVHKIEGLLVKKRIEEAYAAFDANESAFKMYLDDKTFIDLKKRVEQSNSLFQRQKSDAFRIVGALNRLIAQDEGDSAYKVFRQNDVFLSEYLNAQNHSETKSRVARARADYGRNCKIADTLAAKLQALVKYNQVQMAHIRLDEKRDFLTHYLDKATFLQLETTVRAPYEAFMQKLKEARATVSAISGMLQRHQAAAARNEFSRHRKELEHYLPADEFVLIQGKAEQSFRSGIKEKARNGK